MAARAMRRARKSVLCTRRVCLDSRIAPKVPREGVGEGKKGQHARVVYTAMPPWSYLLVFLRFRDTDALLRVRESQLPATHFSKTGSHREPRTLLRAPPSLSTRPISEELEYCPWLDTADCHAINAAPDRGKWDSNPARNSWGA